MSIAAQGQRPALERVLQREPQPRPRSGPPVGRVAHAVTDGSMFWLTRNTFAGS